MTTDHIAEQIGWMDGIMTHPKNATLFDDETLSAIQKELSARWEKENRLELLNKLSNRFLEEDVYAVGTLGINLHYDGNPEGNWRTLPDISP